MAEWEAYSILEPWEEERADLRSAQICTVIANVNRDPKRKPRPWEPKDFMFNYLEAPDERNKPQSLAEMKTALLSLAKKGKA